MKRLGLPAVFAGLMSSGAIAGGIDLNGQPISFIFEEGSRVEVGFGGVWPSVSGNDFAAFGGGASGNIAKTFFPLSFSYKADVNDKLSFGVLVDQPFGATIEYGPGSALFAGTKAETKITAVTTLLRYKFTDRFSAHGGIRVQTGDAQVNLTGAAYRTLSGYQAEISKDTSAGYVLGVAYEIPEYFLRVALTYNSEVEHEFETIESIRGTVVSTSPTAATTPQSVNLEFRTGVAPGTFVFGGVRWAEWSKLVFEPPFLRARTGEGVVNFEDTTSYRLGVGRQFSDTWTGLFSVSYEPAGDPLVSPLSAYTGYWGATLGAVYTKDNLRVTAGVNYTKLGDATPEVGTPDTAVADFRDNDSVGFGVKIGYTF